jgi:asparagine synthase (glutamine-hydrolysing)
MCGIAGCVSIDGRQQPDPQTVRAMLSCLRHRGPDDEGLYSDPRAVLGHRRLSIIDVGGGHQPLHGQRAATVAVVNGEIYNYRELRADLAAAGAVFRTQSDSEIIPVGYDIRGLDLLNALDGMFAFAIWDAAARELLLARDRMGEKPLYFTNVDGLLIFASELAAVLAHPAVPRRVDPVALHQYLALDYVPSPRAMVEGVHKLEPGSFLRITNGSVSVGSYWTIDPLPVLPAPDYAAAVGRLRALIEESVRSRLVSDVPLGVFLSGGLDSSTIAALAARHGAIDTFAIGFDEASFDESAHARAVARHIGSRHHERIVSATEMPDLVPGLATLVDEPLGDASILPTAVLSRFARESVTVALGGDGGDELFAGYPMHQGHVVADRLAFLPAFAWRAAAGIAAALPVSHANFAAGFKLGVFARGAVAPAPQRHGLWMASFTHEMQQRLLHPDLWDMVAGLDPFAPLQARWDRSLGASTLARATHLDAGTYLPDDILAKVDRASMRSGLEVRAPFLAPAVVEFAFGLPDSFRMRRLTGKRILRDAVQDLLPQAILRRPKKGFGMPVAAWLAGPLRSFARDTLTAADAGGGMFSIPAVTTLLDEHDSRIRDHRKPLWTLLVFELWRRHFMAARPQGSINVDVPAGS